MQGLKDKILIIDDSRDFRKLLSRFLQTSGYEITEAENGEDGLQKIVEVKPDLILLDIMMPGIDGYEVCKRIKADPSSRDVPVIFLSGRSETTDKIEGLNVGGADYITKPFDPEMLMLRINNILRRVYSVVEDEYSISRTTMKYNSLELITPAGRERLTLREAQLLRHLMINRNKPLTREQILTEIWGQDDYFLGRSMDVFISRLRKYLSADHGLALRTLRGLGFVLEEIH